ncbi:MAG: ThiF family adenylyltransferase, partial [Candidatus Nanoarchaeia archaeon]|nr:ThiF family adenylyltransferase [Candidatus Nanoarchaeia archaeon]
TNDSYSKEKVLYYSRKYKIPIISASSSKSKGSFSCYWPSENKNKNLEILLNEEYCGETQEGFTSGVIAGLVADEIRKYKFRMAKEDSNFETGKKYTYNIYSKEHRQGISTMKEYILTNYDTKRVLIGGCGALGNSAALGMALLGIGRIDLLDFDITDPTNVPRQILLRGYIGGKKAEIVSRRLREIRENLDCRYIFGKVGESNILNKNIREKYPEGIFSVSPEERGRGIELITESRLLKEKYDLIFGCFDNKYARIWFNEFSVRNKIPYIDGGTNPRSGQVVCYLPGKSRSIDETLHLDRLPNPTRNSCAGTGEPATIIPNMITGNLMVGESIHFLNKRNENPVSSVLQYKSFSESKIFFR